MPAIDLKKSLRELYGATSRKPVLVKVPDLPCLMADGKGDPSTSADFREIINLLYGLSYTLKFQLKKIGKDYTVMPLEGLFCAEDMSAYEEGRRNEWQWTLLMVQPKEVTARRLEEVKEELARKKKISGPIPVRLGKLSEGLCAQVMHIGPYSEEGPTIERLHRFIEENGCAFAGKHHEIYIGYPNRCAPQRLRTIIRQPVRKGKKCARSRREKCARSRREKCARSRREKCARSRREKCARSRRG